HDDEIGAPFQGQPIAGLLVPAITLVAVVAEHKEVVSARHLDRLVGGEIVHQDDVVDDVRRDLAERPLQRARRIVGRQDDTDFLVIDHAAWSPTNFAGDYHYTRVPETGKADPFSLCSLRLMQ